MIVTVHDTQMHVKKIKILELPIKTMIKILVVHIKTYD